MQLRIGQVAPNEAERIEAIEQRHHRTMRSETEPAGEVPVLDEGECGRRGADDVVALVDLHKRSCGGCGHVLAPATSVISRLRAWPLPAHGCGHEPAARPSRPRRPRWRIVSSSLNERPQPR